MPYDAHPAGRAQRARSRARFHDREDRGVVGERPCEVIHHIEPGRVLRYGVAVLQRKQAAEEGGLKVHFPSELHRLHVKRVAVSPLETFSHCERPHATIVAYIPSLADPGEPPETAERVSPVPAGKDPFADVAMRLYLPVESAVFADTVRTSDHFHVLRVGKALHQRRNQSILDHLGGVRGLEELRWLRSVVVLEQPDLARRRLSRWLPSMRAAQRAVGHHVAQHYARWGHHRLRLCRSARGYRCWGMRRRGRWYRRVRRCRSARRRRRWCWGMRRRGRWYRRVRGPQSSCLHRGVRGRRPRRGRGNVHRYAGWRIRGHSRGRWLGFDGGLDARGYGRLAGGLGVEPCGDLRLDGCFYIDLWRTLPSLYETQR